jgi:hypothetical protein
LLQTLAILKLAGDLLDSVGQRDKAGNPKSMQRMREGLMISSSAREKLRNKEANGRVTADAFPCS